MITLETLNAATPSDFTSALAGVFEHAPFVAQRAAPGRPFATVADLHAALLRVVAIAPEAERIAFFCGHPELAARHLAGGLTTESRAEQTGLDMAQAAGAADLPALNEAYRTKFGFPFIVCVARHTAEDVLRTLRGRLDRSRDEELAATLAEIGHITQLRLLALVEGAGRPAPAGHLSTHVLDLQSGSAAEGLGITLLQEGRPVATARTNVDGRVGGAELVPTGPLREGRYELLFDAGAYFASRGGSCFYDQIPVQFVIGSATGRYHIPLLLSSYGYSTYRGS